MPALSHDLDAKIEAVSEVYNVIELSQKTVIAEVMACYPELSQSLAEFVIKQARARRRGGKKVQSHQQFLD